MPILVRKRTPPAVVLVIGHPGSHVGMSWFSLGGNLGFAAGPVLVSPVLGTVGLRGTAWLVLPALLGSVFTVVFLRRFAATAAAAAAATRTRAGSDDWRAFGLLSAVVVCRSIVTFGLSTFLALLVAQRVGGGPLAGEAALALLFGSGAAGTLIGGTLATRWGRMPTVRLAYAATVPALAGLLWVPGPAVFAFVAAVGVMIFIPFSLHVTLGQDYLPHRVGTASGVTLGLAVSVGGIAAPLIGALAERTSLVTALSYLLTLPALSWAIARRLHEPTNAATVADNSGPQVAMPAGPA